jgi:Rhodopirellula transposase DDE domain
MRIGVNTPKRKTVIANAKGRFSKMADHLTERARRLFAASEAMAIGHGGISAVSRATGMAASSIGRGVAELKGMERGEGPEMVATRSRKPGGGRKKETDKDPSLLPDLIALLESTTRGDPESPLLWTARSQHNLAEALKAKGHNASRPMVVRLLKQAGYSLQSNRKKLEGSQHPDRNAQFEHISETLRRQLEANNPAISVDTKKRELVGNFKNAGRELCPKADPVEVKGHDFIDPELGHVSPYGVYDLKANEAWVSVGISHDTGEFAVHSIRTWWEKMGKARYPNANSLVITADGGGSNGYRLRLWKFELQRLVDELKFPITVCHLPPGTSKWNKIEHRLFSFITKNWRGKPLLTHQVIVSLISATKTKAGLHVESHLDDRAYPKGRRISDHQLAVVNIVPNHFHGEWNYTIFPNQPEA